MDPRRGGLIIPRQIHKLKCYVGPYSRNGDGQTTAYGMVHAYSQRQAETPLKIGHKRFMAEWKEELEMVGFAKFVVYVRGVNDSIWTARGD